MYVIGQCKKCKGFLIFDIDNLSDKEIVNNFKKRDFGECIEGYHVEIGKMYDYINLDLKNKFKTSEEAIERKKELKNKEKEFSYEGI